MVKNKDRWSALSMSDRADLIKLYVSNGITSLDAIKKDYNSFDTGGPIETDEYGYPADITPAVVTQDSEFNKFLMTLPDNQRLTPEEDYHTYLSWKLNGKPKTFQEAVDNDLMYSWDESDNSYHGHSVAYDESTDTYYGLKPLHHSTASLDYDTWYQKGIHTLPGGKQVPLEGEDRKEWEDFRKNYNLVFEGNDYKYVPRKSYNSFGDGGDTNSNNNSGSISPERKLTLEEFLQAKADSTRVAALESSRNRTEGIEIVYPLSEKSKNNNTYLLEKYYFANPEFVGPILKDQKDPDYRTYWYQAKKELDNNCDYGSNCIGTATDNYPEDSRTNVNKDFRMNAGEYGFVGIPYEEMLPGDIVQVGDHGMIFDSFSGSVPTFNYSNGSIGPDAYRKQGKYPSNNYSVFRYVGTPGLIQQWTEEYNAQNKKFGRKINRFDIGGPTREMTPLEAAALNKTLNNSQYMLAVGDSPDDPAYLSTDLLEPAVVKAFNSEEDYNRYQGEKFGEYVSNEISEAGTKLAPVLVGAAVAPWAISGGIAAYTNPITRSIIDLAGSIDGIRNAASKNGVRKTIRLAKEGDVWGTTKSAIGDIFDIAGGIGLAGDIYRYGKGAGKRLAESIVRIGDNASKPSYLKEQLLNKDAINYILNPFANPNLAYNLPYKYSGEGTETIFKSHYGDVVDQYFRKVPVGNTLSKTDVPAGVQHYITTHYPKKDVAFINLGEVKHGPLAPYDMGFLNDGEVIKMGQEAARIHTVDGKGLDPGGYNYFATRKGGDLVETGYDIWKFNAEDYAKRYYGHVNPKLNPRNKKIKNFIEKFELSKKLPYYGLKFIDSMGSPIVYKFTKTTPGYYTTSIFNNGGKLNIFETGGPKDGKHIEDVVRTTRGATGRIFTRDFPWVDVMGAKHLWDSWRVMRGNNKKVAPSDDNYTGTAMKGVGVQTDDGLGFVSQQDLTNVLGYTPKDFVDTYVYGVTPFEELGVFKKETSPERHVVRSKVKKVEDSGKQVNTYQTQRDTLDTNTVAALDSLLNAGLVDLRSENTTYQKSPFNIGDSGIIYDGNNSTIATAYLPNGMPVSKAIDVFDTDPKEWNYKVGPLAKTGLSFIHDNTNPFLMTTPWYYPIKSTDFLSRLYYLFGIEADPEYNVISNKGDKNGVVWDLHEALEWLDSHPDLTEMPIKQ